MRLLVVGSLHLDVVLRAPHLPGLDETVIGSDVDYLFGGKGGNQALAAARLGAPVSFAGRAGSDRFGDMLRDRLKSSDIDISQLQSDPGPSGMSAAIVDANGDYGAVVVSAANLHIDADLIDIPADTSVVLLQNEIPEAVNLAVARAAKEMGAAVWLNAAPARALDPELIAALDLMIVNRVEAAFYKGKVRSEIALQTSGAEGVRFGSNRYPAFPVDVVSSHGAGDVFTGALAAQVVAGKSVVQAIPFAQAAAALHVSSGPSDRDKVTAAQVAALVASRQR